MNKAIKSTEVSRSDSVYIDGWKPASSVARHLIEDNYDAVKAVRARCEQIGKLAECVANRIRKGGRLIYVGAGTSGRLAALDAAECPSTFGVDEKTVVAVMAGGPDTFIRAVEGAEDDGNAGRKEMRRLKVNSKDVVCGIAASGTTPFVTAALDQAYKRDATTVLIRNTTRADHEKAYSVHENIVLDTGPEVISGSTRLKAATAQTVLLKTLTTTVFVLLGHTYGGLMVDVKPTNEKLEKRAVRMIQLLTGVEERIAYLLLCGHDKSVKKAVVAHIKRVSSTDAERLLKIHGGRLRDVIGDIDYIKTEVK